MARVKISEFTAKSILISAYRGLSATISTTPAQIKSFLPIDNLVVKVDQGIKKRGKQGLVRVNVTPSDIPSIVKSWSKLGWSNFLIEPVVEHDPNVERYLALERVREGWQVSYSPKGGIEVESHWDQIKVSIYPGSTLPQGLEEFVPNILPVLDANHISFLEMNPIIIRGNKLIPLDMACEVDNMGSSLPMIQDRASIKSEKLVAVLDSSTPASLKFKLLNPEGHIWAFLSGGGASLVIADEVADQDMGNELANYGEYSGAPKSEDVYSYAKIIIDQLLLAKNNQPKAIIIAGGVANFTDVAATFHGLIHALEEKKTKLLEAKVKIFVRRGGPNEERGLCLMRDFLAKSGLLGSVHGHDTPLTEVVTEVKNYLVGADYHSPVGSKNI